MRYGVHEQAGTAPKAVRASMTAACRRANSGAMPMRCQSWQVHAGGVEVGGHADARALAGPLVQELQAGVAEVLVAHAGDLDAAHGDGVGRAVDLPQRDDDLHGLAQARSAVTGEPGLFFGRQFQSTHSFMTSRKTQELQQNVPDYESAGWTFATDAEDRRIRLSMLLYPSLHLTR